MIVVAVIKSDILADRSIRPEATTIVFREPIFSVPVEMLASHSHPLDLLTQMSIRFQHHEGGVSGEDNGVSGMSICTAAV